MMFHVVGGQWFDARYVSGQLQRLVKRNISAVIKNVLWCSMIAKHLWWLCADKLHQQFQKINSRHCRVSESNWNYWSPLMVYLKANLWNLKMYTATGFEKRATTYAWKLFQEKVIIWNEIWTCEWKVSNSISKGVNKTVNERLQTKWLNGQIRVRMC
jgi:hypothetical protein